MSAIPPKHTPETPSYDSSESSGGLVAMYNAASHANAESFPVLKAFQDYLEAERAQARKRVMQLSIFFAVLMGVVVTGFLSAGIFMLKNMSAVQNKLLDVALANKSAPPQPATPAPQAPAVTQLPPALEASVRQMSQATADLRSSLDKKLDGVSEITSKVHDKVVSQDSELENLRSQLQRMQAQSEKLKDELTDLRETAKKAAAQPAAAPVPPTPVHKPPQVSVAAAVPPPAAPSITAAPAVAVAPAALAPAPAPSPQKQSPSPAASSPRFPPAVKDPPVTPAGVTAPPAPQGMLATTVLLETQAGTIPWRVLLPE